MSLIICIIIVARLRKRSEKLDFLAMVIPIFVLAVFVHPTLNSFAICDVTFTQIAWAFSMYLEAIVLYPQLRMIKRGESIENFSVHFVVAMAISRMLSGMFWLLSFSELNMVYVAHWINVFPYLSGYCVLLAQIANCYLAGDFVYNYTKSALFGTPFILPL